MLRLDKKKTPAKGEYAGVTNHPIHRTGQEECPLREGSG